MHMTGGRVIEPKSRGLDETPADFRKNRELKITVDDSLENFAQGQFFLK